MNLYPKGSSKGLPTFPTIRNPLTALLHLGNIPLASTQVQARKGDLSVSVWVTLNGNTKNMILSVQIASA